MHIFPVFGKQELFLQQNNYKTYCGQDFGDDWQMFWEHVERECRLFSFHGEVWKDDVSVKSLKAVVKVEENAVTLWELYQRSFLCDGEVGYKVRMWEEWMTLGMRNVKMVTLAGRIGMIRAGALSSLERDDIRRTVRRQVLPVVAEFDNDETEDDDQWANFDVEVVVDDALVDDVVVDDVVVDVVRERVDVHRGCDVFAEGDAVTRSKRRLLRD